MYYTVTMYKPCGNVSTFPTCLMFQQVPTSSNISQYRPITSFLYFLRFINGMVYFGASYGASDLGGSMYLNYTLTSLIEIPANMLVVDNCGR